MPDVYDCTTIDFETTGVDPKECEPIEVAVYAPHLSPIETLIKPPIPIPPETSAVHHIMDSDVEHCPSWEEVKRDLSDFYTRSPNAQLPVLVAHNANYERTVIGDFVPVLWVCTYKCSLRIWPDAPSHKNEVLRYWLGLGDDRGRNSNQCPHSALHDCKVTYLLLLELLKHATLAELIQWTEEPTKLPYVPFGKHYKQPWSEVPYGYLKWITGQTEMDADVMACAYAEIKRRYPD